MGFAAEVAHCLCLCGETWRKVDKGATNDLMARSMEKQGWAALRREARAGKRSENGEKQLMRAAVEDNLPRVLQLMQLGARSSLKKIAAGRRFTMRASTATSASRRRCSKASARAVAR